MRRWNNLIYVYILIIFDIFAIVLSLKFSIYVRSNLSGDLPIFNILNQSYYWLGAIFFISLVINKTYFDRYDFWEDLKKIGKSIFFAFFIIITILALAKISSDYSRLFIIILSLSTLVFVVFFRFVIKRILFLFSFFRISLRIISFKTEYQNNIKTYLQNNNYLGYDLRDINFDIIIIVSKGFDKTKLNDLIQKYRKQTKNIFIIPYMSFINFANATIINYFDSQISMIKIENKLFNKKDIFIKYISENILTMILLPFIFILHIIISILIKLDSQGSIIYQQRRLGKNKTVFYVYKYRTMYQNQNMLLEEYLDKEEKEHYEKYHKYKNDPRITTIGKILRKTSLDELPQFFNILKGNMSLIGPRPYMVSERHKIKPYDKDVIFHIKPGITGIWQVSGKNDIPFKQRIVLDKWYVQNWSLWLDIVIFFKTFKAILK